MGTGSMVPSVGRSAATGTVEQARCDHRCTGSLHDDEGGRCNSLSPFLFELEQEVQGMSWYQVNATHVRVWCVGFGCPLLRVYLSVHVTVNRGSCDRCSMYRDVERAYVKAYMEHVYAIIYIRVGRWSKRPSLCRICMEGQPVHVLHQQLCRVRATLTRACSFGARVSASRTQQQTMMR